MGSAASSYYITLVAIDPATQLLQTFQTRVNELRYGELVLDCCIARPLGNFFFFLVYNKSVTLLILIFYRRNPHMWNQEKQ